MRTSVILLAYYGDDWIPACVASLASASKEKLHLVLLDNAGNTVLDKLDYSAFDLELLKAPEPLGFAAANNYALVNSRGLEETVLFLNQDTKGEAGWIDACSACFSDPSLGAISPLVRTYDDTGWDQGFEANLATEIGRDPAGERAWFETQVVLAASLIVRTTALIQSGPFDPFYGSYYEDYDLSLRLRRGGWKVGFCRRAKLFHFSGSVTSSPEKARKRTRQILRNRLLYNLRSSDVDRRLAMLRHYAIDLGPRLARGFLKTPSSQPPAVILEAEWDVLKSGDRFASRSRDERAWASYLESIGWRTRAPRLRQKRTDA
ncbi:MAG: glycosyltransferase family 2 protein [Deltaproteobacteria bacterium]|nr:glycosyltransferase family 2 protein [Deltaproteobacteria bacterium]